MLTAPRPRAHRTRTSSRSGPLSRTLLTTVAVTLSLSLSLSTPEATAAPSPTERPVDYSQAAAARYALTHNDQPPPGANDWGCRPTPQHPRPVILVHGSLANMAINWYSLAPLLKNHGYCVFALNYGQDPAHPIGYPGAFPAGATASLAESARQLAAFVDRVQKSTGAPEVDIVGHSQGGLMPRWYLKFLDGANSVHALIGLAPPNHGRDPRDPAAATPQNQAFARLGGDAYTEMITGSPTLTALNTGGDTVPGVDYVVIQTRDDHTVTPYTSAFLDGSDVTNILVQDLCPEAHPAHGDLAYDPFVLNLVLHALDPRTPATSCSVR